MPIDPMLAFADNVTCYMTDKNSFDMAELKIYSTNDNEYALKHLNLDSICKQGDWSAWKEFFTARNISGDKLKLLMGLIWAIYDESYKTRQMIYFYDPHGYSGKSVMLKALSQPLIKINAVANYNESNSNNFTNERLWDKRLLVIPDNKNPLIAKYGRFHLLTGDDSLDVDIKMKRGFTVMPQAKIVGVGNILPEIDLSARHEVSRIALFNLSVDENYYNSKIIHKDGTKGDPKFGDKLKSELEAFLFECRKCAEQINPNKGDFNTDILLEELRQCAESKLIYFEQFIKDNIEFGNNLKTRIIDLSSRYDSYLKIQIDLSARHEVSRIALFNLSVDENYYNSKIIHKDGTKGDPKFGDKLKSELEAFLFECRKCAEQINPNKGDFNTDILLEELRQCAESKLIYFEQFIKDNIEFGNNLKTRIIDLSSRYDSYLKIHSGEWTQLGKPEFKELKEHLTKIIKPNSVEIKRRSDTNYFIGISIKDSSGDEPTHTVGEVPQVDMMNKLTRKEITDVDIQI